MPDDFGFDLEITKPRGKAMLKLTPDQLILLRFLSARGDDDWGRICLEPGSPASGDSMEVLATAGLVERAEIKETIQFGDVEKPLRRMTNKWRVRITSKGLDYLKSVGG